METLNPLPTATRTTLPIITEQEAEQIRRAAEETRAEELRKQAEDARQASMNEITIEASTIEELEDILQKREGELAGYGITKDVIDRELNLVRAAFVEEMEKGKKAEEAKRGASEAGTSRRLHKTCGKRKGGPLRDQQEEQERAKKKRKFQSGQPP